MTSPRVFLAGPPGTGKSVVLQLKATEWLRCGSDVFLVCTSASCAACYRMYYLLQQTIETQLAPTGTSGQLHLLKYDFRRSSDVENAVKDLLQAATGGELHVIADEMDSGFSFNIQMIRDKLLTQVPHLHLWAASYYPKSVPSSWQLQYLTRPIRFPETVKMELARIWTVEHHNSNTYSLHGEYESPSGPPVQRFTLPRHKGSHRRTRTINPCVTCGEHVAKILMQVLAGVPRQGNITSTGIASTRSDTTSLRHQYRDVLILPSVHVRYFMDLETGLRKAGIPVRYMSSDNLEDIVTAREDEVVVADEEDVRGLERKIVVVIVDGLEDAGLLAISRCTSQLVYITYREYYEDCDIQSEDEQKHAEEIQKEEMETEETVAKCLITELEDVKILTPSTLDTDPQYFCVEYPIRLDLSTASLPPAGKPNRSHDECRTGEAPEKSDDMTSSPIFSKHWQDCSYFSAKGGRLQIQGSDVFLQVPAGVIDDNTKVTVHVAICANDAYIKHKLQLPVTETIVSPLAEFKADHDIFQNHIQITLPTCLSSDYDVNLLHVYCITHGGQEEKMNISEIQRQEDMTQTPDKEALTAYFYINEERQVEVMTSHFSGYVCTYCGLCQNIGLEVYESHTYDNESVQVSVIAHLWDKIHISDFRQWKPEDNSYREVLSTTFQLRTMLIPAELQVDLIIDNEETATWRFNQKLAATNTFCLNWGKVTCVNAKEHEAVKYTDLGPFSPGWILKCKPSENSVMPLSLVACIRVSHFKTQESIEPLWHSAPYQVDLQQRNGKENGISNGTNCSFPVVNINNVHGDVTFAQQLITQKTGNVLHLTENIQSTEQSMLKEC